MLLDQLLEAAPAEQRDQRERVVAERVDLRERVARDRDHLVGTPPLGDARAHHGADAGAADPIRTDAELAHRLVHTQMRDAARGTGGEDETECGAGYHARDAGEIVWLIVPHVEMEIDRAG